MRRHGKIEIGPSSLSLVSLVEAPIDRTDWDLQEHRSSLSDRSLQVRQLEILPSEFVVSAPSSALLGRERSEDEEFCRHVTFS
jgi:hypothetical protein